MRQFNFIFIITLLLVTGLNARHRDLPSSGGLLPVLQRKYDATAYNLQLTIDPGTETIAGTVTMQFVVLEEPMDTLLINLIDGYQVEEIVMPGKTQSFIYQNDRLAIPLFSGMNPGESGTVTIRYSGSPPSADKPPWSGGFTWKRDQNGKPWVGVSCQDEGAKIWWPCKDHPSDEPDSVFLHITIPGDLVCAGNGVLDSVTIASPGWKTWHWSTRYPINLYDVTVNIGDYLTVRREITGIAPKPVPLVYYVLKEDTTGAAGLLDQAETMLRFYSRHFGDYPFYKEKFGLAESPFWGMEHQTLNAYGNHYKNTPLGYDFLMLHEMGHEWFGNSMTVHDWADFWLHEGTDIYAEAMFIRDQYGEKEYHRFFQETARRRIQNKQPIVAHRNATSAESYTIDVYYKAAFVLYMLGQMIGPEKVEQVLFDLVTDSLHTGVNGISTGDFMKAIQAQTDLSLDPFFQTYFFSAPLPKLSVKTRYRRESASLTLFLNIPGLSLPVPLAVISGSDTTRSILWVNDQSQEIIVRNCTKIIVDPNQQLLIELRRGWLRRIRDRLQL